MDQGSDKSGRLDPDPEDLEKIVGPFPTPQAEADPLTRREEKDRERKAKATPTDRLVSSYDSQIADLRETRDRYAADCKRLQEALDLIRPAFAASQEALGAALTNNTLSLIALSLGGVLVSVASFINDKCDQILRAAVLCFGLAFIAYGVVSQLITNLRSHSFDKRNPPPSSRGQSA